ESVRARRTQRRAVGSDAARRQGGADHTLLQRLFPAYHGCGDPFHRRHIVAMTVAFLLVLENLAIELVCERINGGVHVRLDALRVNVLAAHMQISRYLLPELVDRKHDVDVDYMVEVPGQTHQLYGHVVADRGRDLEVMPTQIEVHPGLLLLDSMRTVGIIRTSSR